MLYYGTCRAWQGAGSCTDRGRALKVLQGSVGEGTPAKKLQHKAKAADAFEEAQIKHKESPAQGKGRDLQQSCHLVQTRKASLRLQNSTPSAKNSSQFSGRLCSEPPYYCGYTSFTLLFPRCFAFVWEPLFPWKLISFSKSRLLGPLGLYRKPGHPPMRRRTTISGTQ